MYPLLLRLLFLASLLELGISLTQAAPATFERAARQVLKIEWRPISVWPEEAKTLDYTDRLTPSRDP